MSAVTSVQDENIKDMLQYTYTLLKNTRPLLKDEEIRIIAEDMVFRVGLKASNACQDVFKFGSPASQGKKLSKPKNANSLLQDVTTDEKKQSANKTKKPFFFFNSTPKESKVTITLKTERKRSYETSKLNESLKKNPVSNNQSSTSEMDNSQTNGNNVFERLYSFRKKPSKKNLETVKKIREEEKAMKTSKGEPLLKKKRVSISTEEEKINRSANTSFKNFSLNSSNNFERHNPFRQSIKSRRLNNGIGVAPQLPEEESADYIPSASSSTASATSDYQTDLLMDEEKFDQEMNAMNKKLERMAVRYRKDISLCQINIDLV